MYYNKPKVLIDFVVVIWCRHRNSHWNFGTYHTKPNSLLPTELLISLPSAKSVIGKKLTVFEMGERKI
jgi:hypothetical protein